MYLTFYLPHIQHISAIIQPTEKSPSLTSLGIRQFWWWSFVWFFHIRRGGFFYSCAPTLSRQPFFHRTATPFFEIQIPPFLVHPLRLAPIPSPSKKPARPLFSDKFNPFWFSSSNYIPRVCIWGEGGRGSNWGKTWGKSFWVGFWIGLTHFRPFAFLTSSLLATRACKQCNEPVFFISPTWVAGVSELGSFVLE